MIKLGVNVDHIATVRQARKGAFPDPVRLAQAAVDGGADGITAHLREDRRHIQDSDIERLKGGISVPLNLEMAASPEIVAFACRLKPAWSCLVPEKREELTTEGGLNLAAAQKTVGNALLRLKGAGVRVSLFVEPDVKIVRLAKSLGADAVELHTGRYAAVFGSLSNAQELPAAVEAEVTRIREAAEEGEKLGLIVNAGHGVDYDNVRPLAQAFAFHEFNIGFAIVARSLLVGMEAAVQEMKNLIKDAVCVES